MDYRNIIIFKQGFYYEGEIKWNLSKPDIIDAIDVITKILSQGFFYKQILLHPTSKSSKDNCPSDRDFDLI